MNEGQMQVLDKRSVGNPTVYALVADTEDGMVVETMLGNPAEGEELVQRYVDPTDMHGTSPWAVAYFDRNDELKVKGNNVTAKQLAVELMDDYVNCGDYVADVLEPTLHRGRR